MINKIWGQSLRFATISLVSETVKVKYTKKKNYLGEKFKNGYWWHNNTP